MQNGGENSKKQCKMELIPPKNNAICFLELLSVKKDFTGLLAFKKDFPQANLFLFYQGSRPQYMEGITILPIADAYSQLPKLLLNAS